MKKHYEGYKEGVQKLLIAKESNPEIAKRLCGTVADILMMDPKCKIAIGTAIGASIQNLITPTVDDARYLVEYLKENGGVATFMPVETILPKVNSTEIKKAIEEHGAIGMATELVQYDAYYEKIVQNLLGNTLVCDSIQNATEIVKKYPNRFKIVTLDGDSVEVNGKVTGGMCQNLGRFFADKQREDKAINSPIKEKIARRFMETRFPLTQNIQPDTENFHISIALFLCEGLRQYIYDNGKVAAMPNLGPNTTYKMSVSTMREKKKEWHETIEELAEMFENLANSEDPYQLNQEDVDVAFDRLKAIYKELYIVAL